MRILITVLILLSAAALSEDQSNNLLSSGYSDLGAGKYSEALKKFKEANKRQGNNCSECYVGTALAFSKQGQFPEAQQNAQKALEVAKDDLQRANARNALGRIILESGPNDAAHWKEAETEFRAALNLGYQGPVPHLNLGIALLRESRDDEGVEELQKYLSAAPGGPAADLARKLIADPKRARGNYAPDFEVTTASGETLSTQQLAGKIVVLDFWATWCGPCRESLPELKALVKKYPSERVVLLSVSADENEKIWREFIEKKQMTWAQYWDKDGRIAGLFGVHAFPTYILIDPQGMVRQRITGTNPQQSVAYRLKSDLETLVKSLER